MAMSRELTAEAGRRIDHHVPQWVFHSATPFINRVNELDALRNWWRTPNARPLALRGPAGIGKSALLAAWLREMIAQHAGTIFMESVDGPVDNVLKSAVEYFSGTEWNQSRDIRQLRSALERALPRGGPHLFVFDDFDRIGGEDYGVWIDTIEAISRMPDVHILLSLRGSPPPNSDTLEITELPLRETIEWLRAAGVRGTRAELNSLPEWLGGNPAFIAIVTEALRSGRITATSLLELPRPSPRTARPAGKNTVAANGNQRAGRGTRAHDHRA
jgi:hypothetical protein